MQTISGEVIHGKALARTIGFPTANIALENDIVEDGTYKINIIFSSASLRKRASEKQQVFLGAGVYRSKEQLFEAHLFDFAGDLYGEVLEIIILEKIRENRPIDSLEDLKQLIQNDISYIKSTCFYGITFGTFDKFHPGHVYYLQEARKYCQKLITVISTDINVQKIKKHISVHPEKTRKLNVEKSGISDLVYIGEEDDHLKYIKKYSPQIICLGYDQTGFIGELEAFIKTSEIKTEIIRIGSHKPEKYKSSKM